MKILNTLFILFTGVIIISCSKNNISEDLTSLNKKKIIKISTTDNYGIYENLFVYDSNNVREITKKFTKNGETIPNIGKEIFSYENNIITSSSIFSNGQLYLTNKFSYSNDQLTQKISYKTDGVEYEKLEFKYNLNGKIIRLSYHVNGILQQVTNLTYNSNDNIITIDESGDFSEIQYDDNPTPYNNFSDPNKIIFNQNNSRLIYNISRNNTINEIKTYNNNSSNELIYSYQTTNTYDLDNFPLSKTIVETNNKNEQRTLRSIDYEYE